MRNGTTARALSKNTETSVNTRKMRSVEFYTTPQGELYFEEDHQSKRVTKFSEVVKELYGIIEERFPEAFKALEQIHGKSKRLGAGVRQYRMVTHFIRCNFAERDTLTADYEGGRLHFEEVKCPMRGEPWLCPYEGKICKPKGMAKLSGTEWTVAQLYASGYSAREIGEQTGKSMSTVKTQLASCKKKLGLGNCREIVKFLRLRNL